MFPSSNHPRHFPFIIFSFLYMCSRVTLSSPIPLSPLSSMYLPCTPGGLCCRIRHPSNQFTFLCFDHLVTPNFHGEWVFFLSYAAPDSDGSFLCVSNNNNPSPSSFLLTD
ncbi:hypothetical protein BDQ94DRAFT_53374 [Aspergillus welwitschiae]|uniref:Secreted protein n=1 Tax=Aspergillus welwitschiae TaxID=1341132 RepID=A0A3F3PYE7_9EURO|nr:hypothetical protein BDQ94DRAFT_53374 [Aspergillus welwitschiae]RDH31939.1 hypothetical protein BDQ94DRAFT_53374 [Aspergillus welwitschiae]